MRWSKLPKLPSKTKLVKDIKVADGRICLRFEGFHRGETEIQRENITALHIARVPSLCDELGIWITTHETYCLVETDPGARELFSFLRLNELFGKNWYIEAEQGRVFAWQGSLQD